jgi:hypothetical protein
VEPDSAVFLTIRSLTSNFILGAESRFSCVHVHDAVESGPSCILGTMEPDSAVYLTLWSLTSNFILGVSCVHVHEAVESGLAVSSAPWSLIQLCT